MPQLIAMIIVVVGAMIYMFQTFGGTGDKIEGVAQKASVITEINNVKNAVKLAARAEQVTTGNIVVGKGEGNADVTIVGNTMYALGLQNYFAEQMNEQIVKVATKGTNLSTDSDYSKTNAYNAISFGGNDNALGGLVISLVANKKDKIPGIYVNFNFTGSTLADSAGFLESQIANDLKDIAFIDRKANSPVAADGDWSSATDASAIEKRTPGKSSAGTESDGKFIIYFKDFGSNEVVK